MSSTFEQIPFAFAEFAENPEPRCPCVLVLDTSGSMKGEPIKQLNEGLQDLKESLKSDRLASKRVELAIITFGPVRLHSDFMTVDEFQPPQLRAEGSTPMGEAMMKAIEVIEKRKNAYKTAGMAYYRPWIFLLSDGDPTGPWHEAALATKNANDKNQVVCFAVAVGAANINVLAEFTSRTPLKLQGLKFKELFVWLSQSLRSVSYSQTEDKILLPSPQGWAEL